MAPKSVTFRRHDHLVSVLFGDLLSHSYNITFSMFLYLVTVVFADFACQSYKHKILDCILFIYFFGRSISYNCVCSSGRRYSWINQSKAQLEGAAVLFWFSG